MQSQIPGITNDDKLMAALAYLFAPVSGLIFMALEDKKARPFIKYHAVQSIVVSIALFVVVLITSTFTFGCSSILYLVMIWYAYRAYQGEMFEVPVVTDFIKGQGWI